MAVVHVEACSLCGAPGEIVTRPYTQTAYRPHTRGTDKGEDMTGDTWHYRHDPRPPTTLYECEDCRRYVESFLGHNCDTRGPAGSGLLDVLDDNDWSPWSEIEGDAA